MCWAPGLVQRPWHTGWAFLEVPRTQRNRSMAPSWRQKLHLVPSPRESSELHICIFNRTRAAGLPPRLSPSAFSSVSFPREGWKHSHLLSLPDPGKKKWRKKCTLSRRSVFVLLYNHGERQLLPSVVWLNDLVALVGLLCWPVVSSYFCKLVAGNTSLRKYWKLSPP